MTAFYNEIDFIPAQARSARSACDPAARGMSGRAPTPCRAIGNFVHSAMPHCGDARVYARRPVHVSHRSFRMLAARAGWCAEIGQGCYPEVVSPWCASGISAPYPGSAYGNPGRFSCCSPRGIYQSKAICCAAPFRLRTTFRISGTSARHREIESGFSSCEPTCSGVSSKADWCGTPAYRHCIPRTSIPTSASPIHFRGKPS